MRKFEFFIANKFNKAGGSSKRTRPVIRISIIAIAISTAVIILTAAVVHGFKNEITEKVIGFSAHIEVSDYQSLNAYETVAIKKDSTIEAMLQSEDIKHIQPFVTKPALLKNGETVQANVLKGVNEAFDPSFFKKHLVSGQIPEKLGQEIIISQKTADILEAEVGDEIFLYFIQDPPRIRKLEISGIYSSGFAQFDDLMAITNISILQKVNDWEENEYSGYEFFIEDFSKLEEVTEDVYRDAPDHLNAQNVFEKYPDIFNWLELQDINYYIILILMILVAVINSISALIILILEKASVIGVLKTLGVNNLSIKRIFIIQGSYLLLRGLYWGNMIGAGLAILQDRFHLIKLPVESYYLSSVPISLGIMDLIIINLSAFVICMLALILPAHLISGISIAKVIKFDR